MMRWILVLCAPMNWKNVKILEGVEMHVFGKAVPNELSIMSYPKKKKNPI